MTKKSLVKLAVIFMVLTLLVVSCAPAAPQIIEKTVIVEKPVEVVKTVIVEKPVEVKQTVEVIKNAPIGPLRTVRLTHGGSLCNLPLFVAFEHPEWWAEVGLSPESVPSPSITEQMGAINAGLVDFSGAPYTSQLASIAQSNGEIKIVTGIGVGGLGLITHKGKETPATLKGSKWGLSPSDTLEVLGYEYLAKNGMSYKDIEVIYEGAGVDVMGSWVANKIDVVNCVQPYCDDFVKQYDAVLLANGEDVFGPDYSDCVVSTSKKLIKDEPKVVEGLITVLMRGQQSIEKDLEGSLKLAFGKWFKVSDISVAVRAMERVHPMIDQRSNTDFIMKGVDFMLKLGYIPEDLKSTVDSPDKVFDWSILEKTIKDNPDLYNSLQRKSK